jgi:anti-sigma factor RsiW
MPLGGEPSGYGNHEHATWDAAYVLGALSAADRREFEAHMSGCPSCREAVGELSGMPALLSQIDCDQAAAIAADAPQVSQPRPEVLTSLLTRVRRQRRRSRLVTWLCAAAAAIGLTIGVFVGIGGHSVTSAPPQPSVSALPMAPVGTTRLTSTVSVSSRRWGTFIDLECVCLAPAHAHHDRLAMVVVGRDGTRTQLATWVAEPGHTARPAASISMPIDQIAAVQVVSVDNGNVLLHRSL